MDTTFRNSSDAAIRAYRSEGYFIEPGVFDSAECDSIVQAALRLPAAQQGDLRPAMQPHRDHPVFLQAMRIPQIVGTMRRLVEGEPVGLQTQFYYSPPGVQGLSHHQDNFFVEAPDDAFASAWIALVDVSAENGGLYGFPRSHLAGRLPVRKIDRPAGAQQDPNSSNEETVLPSGLERLELSVPRGAVVYIHANFVHGSNPNRGNANRFALLCTYVRRGAPFRPGRNARREVVELG